MSVGPDGSSLGRTSDREDLGEVLEEDRLPLGEGGVGDTAHLVLRRTGANCLDRLGPWKSASAH